MALGKFQPFCREPVFFSFVFRCKVFFSGAERGVYEYNGFAGDEGVDQGKDREEGKGVGSIVLSRAVFAFFKYLLRIGV